MAELVHRPSTDYQNGGQTPDHALARVVLSFRKDGCLLRCLRKVVIAIHPSPDTHSPAARTRPSEGSVTHLLTKFLQQQDNGYRIRARRANRRGRARPEIAIRDAHIIRSRRSAGSRLPRSRRERVDARDGRVARRVSEGVIICGQAHRNDIK